MIPKRTIIATLASIKTREKNAPAIKTMIEETMNIIIPTPRLVEVISRYTSNPAKITGIAIERMRLEISKNFFIVFIYLILLKDQFIYTTILAYLI